MDQIYRRLVEQAYDGFWLLDKEFMTVYVNPALEKMLGYAKAEMIGRSWYDFGDPTWVARAKELERRRKSGVKEPHQFLFVHKDGSSVLTRIAVTPLFDGDSSFEGAIGVLSNLATDEALRESEMLFKKMFTQAPLGIALIDSLSGQIYEVNPMFAEIAGRPIEELATIDWMRITHPDDIQQNLDNLALLNAGKIHGFQMEKRYLHQDGTAVWTHMTGAPVEVVDTAHPRHLCMIQDITERKALQEKLKQSELYYRTIADFTADWEYWILPDGTLRYVSPSCAQISGYSAEQFYADPQLLTRMIHPDDLPVFEGHSHRLASQGVPLPIDFRIRTRAGETVWISHVCHPVHDPAGQPLGLRASNRDITERKQVEAALARSHADLQRFAEVTAHHLQEPARRMSNYAERLHAQLAGRLDFAEAQLSLEYIGQQARRQQNLLRDIERYLAADQARGALQAVNAQGCVASLLARWKTRIEQAGAQITLGQLPPAWIDRPRLNDLFEVTLDNALCHGRGERPLQILIEGKRVGEKACYTVADNGPGVEAQYRERVFRVFERLAPGGDGSSTGIGLAILRRVSESCGGGAWIEESSGGGCRVVFELAAEKRP
jgi:PAS domain S-box-containing protein